MPLPSSTPELSLAQHGACLWLTITREERRNAMSHSLLATLAEAINAAQQQREICAIVLTGAGTKAFCAGADLQAAKAFTTDHSDPQGHTSRACCARRAPATSR